MANLESNPLATTPHNPDSPVMSFTKLQNLVWFLSLFPGQYLASITGNEMKQGVPCHLHEKVSKEEL
jgi:hypothetical protein